MRTFLLAAVCLMVSLFTAETSYAQHRRPFVFGGVGATPSKDISLSAEAGYWGIESSTSFALTYEAGFNATSDTKEFSHWVGFKPYFTVLDNKEISLMVYLTPKFNTQDFGNAVVEYGFNPNYKVGNDYLISTTIGNQTSRTSQLSIFTSVGLIRLF